MAILKHGGNEVEVKIKRKSSGTYYDGYVKVDSRESPFGRSRERYIVGRPGEVYSIEINLKKGYSYAGLRGVKASLYVSGTKASVSRKTYNVPNQRTRVSNNDVTIRLEKTNSSIGDQALVGAEFIFKQLNLDEDLQDGTSSLDIHPEDLGNFCIKIYRVVGQKDLTEEDKARRSASASAKRKLLEKQMGEDIDKVDKGSYKDRGIVAHAGLSGGNWKPRNASHTAIHDKSSVLTFNFYSRSPQTLQHLNIIRYPPPLYSYAWALLSEPEKKFVLKELQDFSKGLAQQEKEASSKDDPKEWRPWSTMYAWERQKAFDLLRKVYKDHEKYNAIDDPAEVQTEIAHQTDSEDLDNEQPLIKEEPADVESLSQDEDDDVDIPLVQGNAAREMNGPEQALRDSYIHLNGVSASNMRNPTPAIKAEPVIKDKVNEDQGRPPKRRRVEIIILDDDDDDEIKRMEAEERKLAKDIEEAERLAEMKRKREALQEKIETAKARKLLH